MFQRFLRTMSIDRHQTLLDVGVTCDRSYESSNYLEAWYPYKDMITAVGLTDASFLEDLYPGVTFVSANGCHLPFAESEFDFVHSSAVLEHVGSEENQKRFVAELYRVARHGVCISTPNRWFPVEFHTVLPLVHWLPKRYFRWLMRNSGREFFSREENLNLLSRADLHRIVLELGPAKAKIDSIKLWGLTSNLLLFLWK